jgi:hypothetical protein
VDTWVTDAALSAEAAEAAREYVRELVLAPTSI